ncbi:MAG: TonB-dependent receptor domain-containing protein, partial [Spirosomataceae bacterium]
HSKDLSFGINWKHNINDSWVISNNARYSAKNLDINSQTATNFTYLDDVVTNSFSGATTLGSGIITYKDRESGQILATVSQTFGQRGPSYTVLTNSLPGIVPERPSVRYSGSGKNVIALNEFMDQFSITKKLKIGSITAGMFYANSAISGSPDMAAPVLLLSPIGDKTKPMDVTFKSSTPGNTATYQLSDPSTGYLKLGGSFGFARYEYTYNQTAFFLGNNLDLTSKLNLDWGLRYEANSIVGENVRTSPSTKTGGLDGVATTVYDSFYGVYNTNSVKFDKNINTFSYSAGLNYKFNDNNALYVRYTKGQKSPDLSFFQTYTNDFIANNSEPLNQDVIQAELGYKLKTNNFRLLVTPFLSMLKSIGTTALSDEPVPGSTTTQLYYTPIVYNSVQTKGIEVEGDVDFNKHFNLRAAFTVQNAEYTNWQTWNVGVTGRQDDKLVDYTGNTAENNPTVLFTITPTYSVGKFYALVQWKYMGERQANQPNAYILPAFSQFDLSSGYNFSSKLSLMLNINNVTDVLGIMGSASPGGIIASFSPQNITKAQVEANPNAVHSIIPIQPRAYFLTLSYKF